jgi:hypothetical protein
MSEDLSRSGDAAEGMTNRKGQTCWIASSKFAAHSTKLGLLATVGHEAGHIFVGYGHPNNPFDRGDAYLPGIDQRAGRLRLMTDGSLSGLGSRLLVKKEWDLAEAWLSQFVDAPQI